MSHRFTTWFRLQAWLRVTTCAAVVTIIGSSPAAVADAAGTMKPNVILIMADDMGRDWVSCYGADHKTPNVDRLAAGGVRFNNVWCTPICTPTRIELLTGLYPCRTGWVKHHDVPRWGGKGFDWDKFTCWARVLRDAGYATAVGGKWQVNDFRQFPDALKLHGFDEHCMWTGYETGNAPPSDERYWDAYLMTNGKREIHQGQYGPTVINDFVIDFIKRHKSQPFLVYYPMLEPHGPHVPTPLNRDDAESGEKGKDKAWAYAGQVTHVDHLVGTVMETLDELGIAQKTMLVFTCDNGSAASGRLSGQAYPKGKGKVANWGANVPFIVRAPFLTGTNVGRASDDLIDFTDVYPTLVELAGAKMPGRSALDGRSFLGLIDGTARAQDKRTWIYSQLGNGRMVRDQRFLLDDRGDLYDLEADPLQEESLAESADPEVSAARERLGKVLAGTPPDAGPPFEGFRSGNR